MPQPSLWDQGLWDEARWDLITIEGAITEGPDAVLGGIAVIDPVGGLITEAPDVVVGQVTVTHAVSGDITENHDGVTGTVSVIQYVTGDITENEDLANGEVNVINQLVGDIAETEDDVFGFIEPGPTSVFGDPTEGEDQVNNLDLITVSLSGAVVENIDKVRGNLFGISGYRRPGGGWAPQFYYEREWEKKPEEVLIVEEIIEPELEVDPYFIPQALPMDPAVARILQSIMQGPAVVDTDDEDIEEILMHL